MYRSVMALELCRALSLTCSRELCLASSEMPVCISQWTVGLACWLLLCRGELSLRSVGGVEIVGKSVHESLHEGIAFVPESRELNGLIGSFSIAENLILDTHREAPYTKGFALSPKAVAIRGEEQAKEFDIRYQSIQDPVSSLSGGNKQKVVVARELSRPVKLVVASQPTRGLDVGSIEFVHERILAERDAGRAVLLFSTELDEVVALADRIAVMYAGKILAIVDATVSREELGLLMAGVKK